MNRTRRTFLQTASLLPALGVPSVCGGAPQPTSVAESPIYSSFDPWIEVHAGHLTLNVGEIARRVRPRPILAVLKNNAYGLGIATVGRLLDTEPAIAGFAVVKLNEAVTLRDAGIHKPILLMGPYDEQNLDEAVARDIMPMVYTPVGALIDRLAARRQRPVPLHICVDTGIGRVGVPYREAAPFIGDLAARRSAAIEGVMMTFTEDPDYDQEQLRRFLTITGGLQQKGATLGRRHAASSFGLFQRPEAFLDLVRPGMAIYGIYSEAPFRTQNVLDLRPAVSLKARVVYVKRLSKGDSAGYNRAYVAKDEVWVATLPVGHADGWPRAAAKGARVRIGGTLYPVIASVSASHTIVEIGPQPAVRMGDVATLFDWQEGSRPEDVAEACSGSVYDLTMHLGPLLRRTVVS